MALASGMGSRIWAFHSLTKRVGGMPWPSESTGSFDRTNGHLLTQPTAEWPGAKLRRNVPGTIFLSPIMSYTDGAPS